MSVCYEPRRLEWTPSEDLFPYIIHSGSDLFVSLVQLAAPSNSGLLYLGAPEVINTAKIEST